MVLDWRWVEDHDYGVLSRPISISSADDGGSYYDQSKKKKYRKDKREFSLLKSHWSERDEKQNYVYDKNEFA